MTQPLRTPLAPRAGVFLALVAGVVVGGLLVSARNPVVRAGGSDRWDESILAAGPVSVRYNEGTKVQVAQDAIYYLDYRAGKLMGMIPGYRQTLKSTTMLETFAERDLVADFKLDAEGVGRPHFLMTNGSMTSGSGSANTAEGWAPLFVVETTTRQLAVYKLEQKLVGTNSQTRLELVEIKPFSSRANAAK